MRERVMRPTKHYVIEYLCFQRCCITASLMDNSFQFVIYQRTMMIVIITRLMMELILINIHVCLSLDASLGALKFAGHTQTDIIGILICQHTKHYIYIYKAQAEQRRN
jgi:hypothetical protein